MRPLGRTDPTHVASYRLLGILGEGGMGRVYLGQSRSGRKIAIKVLSPRVAEDAQYRERFAREVAAARAVNPLFTAAVVDAGPDAEVPWLATTFINGPSLQEWVRIRGPLPERTVLTLAAGLAEALASIHLAGLVHRDLTPSNVLIDQLGPHIIDFGIALNTSAVRITTTMLVGTPSYMAPERVHGADADPAGDMFSLGATIFFACTGEELVREGSFYEQISQVALGRFDLSKVPSVCRSIIVRCLSPQPMDRPTAEELSRILAGLGVLAPGPGWADATGGPPAERVTADDPSLPAASRRRMILGGAFGIMAIGAAVVVAPRLLRRPQTTSLVPGASPTPSAVPRARVLWQTTVDADRPGMAARADASVAQVLVDSKGRVISARGSMLKATDGPDRQIWTRSLPSGNVELRRWAGDVLASDLRRLWLVSAETGQVIFDFDAGEQIDRVAVTPDQVFFNVRNAMISLDRSGKVIWRVAGSSAPLATDTEWLLAREPDGSATRLSLHQVTNGVSTWSVREDPAPTEQPPPPPPQQKGPPHNDAHERSEARLGASFAVLRNRQEILSRQLGNGQIAWHIRMPKPVVTMELAGDLVIIAADRLTARLVTTGEQRWDLPIRGARLALTQDRATIIAATDDSVSALNMAGQIRWQIPSPRPDSRPDSVSADARAAYIVYRPREDESDSAGLDVVSIDLS